MPYAQRICGRPFRPHHGSRSLSFPRLAWRGPAGAGAEVRARGEGGALKLLRDRPRPMEILDESDLENEDLGPETDGEAV